MATATFEFGGMSTLHQSLFWGIVAIAAVALAVSAIMAATAARRPHGHDSEGEAAPDAKSIKTRSGAIVFLLLSLVLLWAAFYREGALLVCSPKPDPSAMRVFPAHLAKEILDEA